MSDWLEDFQMMGVKLNFVEKSLMKFAMNKERERIIKLLEIECEVSCDECWDEGVKNVITRLRADSNE
jgi:hypothetical protein